MLNRFFLLIIALVAGFVFAYFKNTASTVSEFDINSVELSFNEQQQAVLIFEKELQCDNFGTCFYSIVDGALESNPANASKACKEALDGIRSVNIPEELPEKVQNMMYEVKNILEKQTEWSLKSAQFANHEVEQSAGFPPVGCSTCKAYGIIDKINNIYGLRKIMGKQYINCDAINEAIE
ncbi:MAG TPA: hypothetical protein P5556_08465 [Candidatus Gastranaerophilales bacterium]|nr:hypothetical protein [Candidatus Gastranaerophilales bacterium]